LLGGSVEDRTLDKLHSAAAEGDASAQFSLSIAYIEARGVAQDWEKAAEFARAAAGQGHVEAQFQIAQLLCQGRPLLSNLSQAPASLIPFPDQLDSLGLEKSLKSAQLM
jgi:TPR repeat protein